MPGNHSLKEIRQALDPNGGYVLIGHDAFGATGRHWLGSIPRMVGLMARSAVDPVAARVARSRHRTSVD